MKPRFQILWLSDILKSLPKKDSKCLLNSFPITHPITERVNGYITLNMISFSLIQNDEDSISELMADKDNKSRFKLEKVGQVRGQISVKS